MFRPWDSAVMCPPGPFRNEGFSCWECSLQDALSCQPTGGLLALAGAENTQCLLGAGCKDPLILCRNLGQLCLSVSDFLVEFSMAFACSASPLAQCYLLPFLPSGVYHQSN